MTSTYMPNATRKNEHRKAIYPRRTQLDEKGMRRVEKKNRFEKSRAVVIVSFVDVWAEQWTEFSETRWYSYVCSSVHIMYYYVGTWALSSRRKKKWFWKWKRWGDAVFSLINARTNRAELTRKSANSERNGRFENEKKKRRKEKRTYDVHT